MRVRTHLHAEFIQVISNILEHSPHPIHFYEVKAHTGIIGNEGADACARAASLTDTADIALPDARDPFHNFYWLPLKSSHGRNSDPHHSHTTPTYYLTNPTDKLKARMHNRHKLDSADTSGYYYISRQRLNYTVQPTPKHHCWFKSSYPTLSTCHKEISNFFGTIQRSPLNIRQMY
eukprot:1156752-Pelagomonas_calceolata.AAC.2